MGDPGRAEHAGGTAPAWGSPRAIGSGRLDGHVVADACVVGLGASGLAAVTALVDRGLDTVGVDAIGPGGGASGRNGGFLLAGTAAFHHHAVRRFGRARACALYRLTLGEIDRVAREHPTAVRRVGSLRIAADDAERSDCAEHRRALLEDGFRAEAYDGPEGTGVLIPDDAAFHPAQRCEDAARTAVAAGARLFRDTRVTRVERGRVTTTDGRVAADTVVVAVDGGLEVLIPSLASRVATTRAQMLATALVDGDVARRPVYRRYGYDYYQQLPDGRVLLGGFRDAGGSAEWSREARPTVIVQTRLERFLRGDLGVTAPVTHRWAGLMGMSTSGLPVLDALDTHLVACGGYSGTGNLLGPIVAREAVELALTGRSSLSELLAG